MVEFGVFDTATLKPSAALYNPCVYWPEWCEEGPSGMGF